MRQYLDLLKRILDHGSDRPDRTGVGTRGLFGEMLRFDLSEGFPLVTTKRIHWKSVVGELLWMLSGGCFTSDLREQFGVTIWDEWGRGEEGYLGPIYGVQWREWDWTNYSFRKEIDQISNLVAALRKDPFSRRHLVSAWNVGDLPEMALPPCHYAFQMNVDSDRLSCLVNMRSSDVFLGLPFNVASYALLTHMLAQVTGYRPGMLIMSLGDVHLYRNHVEQARLQLAREPLPLPTLELDPVIREIDDFSPEHIHLIGYQSHAPISAEVAV